uniref:Uncharacterized protein n=1 Tax=Solanum lycopersicum TaxID=4081 RepID=A0A3Q7I4L9_SOLLC
MPRYFFDMVYVTHCLSLSMSTISLSLEATLSVSIRLSLPSLISNIHYFISVEVIRSCSGSILTQANYVNEI